MNDAFFTRLPASANLPAHSVHGSWVNSAGAVRPVNGLSGHDRCRIRRLRDFGSFRGPRLSQVEAVTARRFRPATLVSKGARMPIDVTQPAAPPANLASFSEPPCAC